MCQNESSVNDAQGAKPYSPMGCCNYLDIVGNICRDVNRTERPLFLRMAEGCFCLFGSGLSGLGL